MKALTFLLRLHNKLEIGQGEIRYCPTNSTIILGEQPMAISVVDQQNKTTLNDKSQPYALAWLTSLFFLWGFITCLNDILIPHLKSSFNLNYSQAMLVQFCFFGAYFLVSLPAGKLVERVGYQRGIVIGLLISGLGCALFYPAAQIHTYGLFLGALFVLASGITLLQVSANPYVAKLGNAKTASSRLTMTQAFNSLGTTVAPFFGALLILDSAAKASQDASSVQMPYLLLAASFVFLAIVFALLKLPTIETEQTEQASGSIFSALHDKTLRLGVVAIFVYVGAEVAIGSFIVSFMMESTGLVLTEKEAASYLAYYWGGAMVGRFIGAAVMQKIAGAKVLLAHSIAAMILIAIAILGSGSVAMWALLLVGLCNSIMFPTIFSLAVRDLKGNTASGSGLLCLAIVGGAIVPLVQGLMADQIGLQLSFILPIVCYAFIAYYGRYLSTRLAHTNN
ncbi:Predicted glucose transporter in beta-glucoside utilization gene cluster [Pseudoalteromonas luteoviolacea B = ATCC 29581]|nr:Predicted glucose transporter in beta-glucoside utilization gene cluster [Pseudoalteromonas luteoviolacea B = ATCC 29581]